jgi:hypothetical protein
VARRSTISNHSASGMSRHATNHVNESPLPHALADAQLLVRSLASELAAVMARRVRWSIRNLRDRREALIAGQEEQKRKAELTQGVVGAGTASIGPLAFTPSRIWTYYE